MRKIPLVQAWFVEKVMNLTCCCHLNLEYGVLPACQEYRVCVASEDPTKTIISYSVIMKIFKKKYIHKSTFKTQARHNNVVLVCISSQHIISKMIN